jgi:hypothetical protein
MNPYLKRYVRCPMLNPGKLKTDPIKIGSTINPPETKTGRHHIQNPANRCSFVLKPSEFPGVKKAEIVVGVNSIYLPYYPREIASIRLPTNGPTFFFTDNMSGCAFFIDRFQNGDLVVYHANSLEGSDKVTMEAHVPSYQSRKAVGELGSLYFAARSSYPGAVPDKALYKTEYLKIVDVAMRIRHATKEIDDTTGKHYLGATTIIGFRNGAKWDFWFQNWMQVRGKVQVVYHKKFY